MTAGAMAGQGFDRLRRQHEQLLAALDELEVTVGAEPRARLLVHIGQRLKAHMAVEEEVVYPAVERCGAAAATAVAAGLESHRAADLLLDEAVGGVTPARVEGLRELLARHFDDEEQTVFRFARRLGEAGRRDLGLAVDAYLDEFGDGTADGPAPAA